MGPLIRSIEEKVQNLRTGPYIKLVHKNPKLNDKNLWYRLVGTTQNGAWYLCTIWGPQGMINSTVHAAPCEDYTLTEYRQKDGVAPQPITEPENEFI